MISSGLCLFCFIVRGLGYPNPLTPHGPVLLAAVRLVILDLDKEVPQFAVVGGMYVGAGGYTIEWSDLVFRFSTELLTVVAFDAGHSYGLTARVNDGASAAQKAQVVSVFSSFTSTNTFDPVADDDGDGLRGDLEFVQGSSDSDPDSDNDGLNDKVEYDLGSDPTQGQLPLLKTLISDYPDAFDGVFTDEQVQAGRFGDLFIEVNGGTASLALSVQESDALETWTEATQVQVDIPVSADKKFFQFHVP